MSSVPSYPGALPPPPGVIPNIDDGASALQSTWTAALSVELAVPTICMLLRLYIRLALAKKWTKSDTVFMVAWALFVCEIGLGLSLTQYGVGLDAWNVTPLKFSRFAENLNIQQIVYMPAICLTKVGILLQLKEIFVPSRSMRFWAIMGFIGFNLIFFTILMFLEIFQCVPRPKIWNPMLPGQCIDINSTFVATGVINVIDDFAILILPIAWILKLQTTTKKKLSISAVFLVGLFACICSVMRLAESIISLSSQNITVSLVPVSLWATAEISSGLTVATLPYLPRLFKSAGPGTQLEQHRFYRLTAFRRNKSSAFSTTDNSQTEIAAKQAAGWGSHSSIPKVPRPAGGGITKTVDISTRSDSFA